MDDNAAVKTRLLALYEELFAHDGYGTLRVELRILRRGQKEVILDCGKQYRFVVDYAPGFRVHKKHAARLQSSLTQNVLGRYVQDADFGGHHHKPVLGYVVT